MLVHMSAAVQCNAEQAEKLAEVEARHKKFAREIEVRSRPCGGVSGPCNEEHHSGAR